MVLVHHCRYWNAADSDVDVTYVFQVNLHCEIVWADGVGI